MLALGAIAHAQADEPRPLVEGPPDADVVLEGAQRALDRLIAGDLAWKEGKRESAFDAWREALVSSRDEPGAARSGTVVAPPPFLGPDPDGTLPRRAEDALHAVRRRIAAIGTTGSREWRARFEALAQSEFEAARGSAFHWAAVQREFPFTRAAARAALALADLAAERGEAASAELWLARARLDAAREDETLRTAIASRSRAPATREAPPTSRPTRLVLESRIDLGPTPDSRDATIPGLAFVEDDAVLARTDGEPPRDFGATWFHAHGRLLRFDGGARATASIDLGSAGIEIAPAFSEPGAPWDERFAARAEHLALVVGRARETHGNALVGVEAGAIPRVTWARDSDHLLVEGAPVETAPLVGTRALLEFQPGPLFVGDVLVVHVRAWPRNPEGEDDLDEARAEAWCVAFDPRDGSAVWSRRLATGSTSRGMDRGRMDPPEPTSWPALPPVATDSGAVVVDTGLGAIACVEVLDGRVDWILRTARRDTRPTAAGGLVTRLGRVWAVPAAEAGALLRLAPTGDVGTGIFQRAPLVLGRARIALDLDEGAPSTWIAWADFGRGVVLVRQDLATGIETRSTEIPFADLERGSVAAAPISSGWIATAGGRAWSLDPGLRMQADLEVGSRNRFARVSTIARRGSSSADFVRIAGPNSLVFLRSE